MLHYHGNGPQYTTTEKVGLRQVILIFIDNMITGVLVIISPLKIFHQLSLIISYDKHSGLVILQIQPRFAYNAC